MQVKAYAATQSLTPRLIDDYTSGRGANVSEILRIYYKGENTEALLGTLVICFHVIVPPFASIVIGCVLWYFNNTILKYLKNEEDENQSFATKVLIVVLSFLFLICFVSLDGCAIHFRNFKLPSAVADYHNRNDSEYFYNLPVVALFYDELFLISHISICFYLSKEKDSLGHCVLFSIFMIISTISNHLVYILIAVINDPGYASGVLTYYTLFVVVYVLSINKVIASTIARYNSCNNNSCLVVCSVILICIVSIILIGLAALTIVLIVYIPIKNSIADIPREIQSLFNFATAFFVGLVTYKVLQKPKRVIINPGENPGSESDE